jgi:hypothetical protein
VCTSLIRLDDVSFEFGFKTSKAASSRVSARVPSLYNAPVPRQWDSTTDATGADLVKVYERVRSSGPDGLRKPDLQVGHMSLSRSMDADELGAARFESSRASSYPSCHFDCRFSACLLGWLRYRSSCPHRFLARVAEYRSEAQAERYWGRHARRRGRDQVRSATMGRCLGTTDRRCLDSSVELRSWMACGPSRYDGGESPQARFERKAKLMCVAHTQTKVESCHGQTRDERGTAVLVR